MRKRKIFFYKNGGVEMGKYYPYGVFCNKYGCWCDDVIDITDGCNECNGNCCECDYASNPK